MKDKNSELKLLIIVAIILLCIIFGLLLYKKYFYSKNDDLKENNVNEEENVPEIKIEDIAISSKMVKDAMNSFEKIKITEESAYGKQFDIKNISNYELLDTAFSEMLEEGIIKSACSFEKSEALTLEEINSKLKEIFNYNYNISLKDIENNSEESEPGSKMRTLGIYDIQIEDSKVYVSAPCDGGGGFTFINKKITKAEKDNNKLYIYSTNAFGLYDFDVVEYYDDYKRTNQKEMLKVGDYKDIDVDKIPANWDLYKSYKYTFKIVGSKYFIEKIEEIKDKG